MYELINNEESQQKESLNPSGLNNTIKSIDQSTTKGLIVKCQILTLFKRHELYKDLKYKTLETFARKEHRLSRIQLNKYVKIWEQFETRLIALYNDDRKSTYGLVEKLYLLASIDEKEKIDSWYNTIFDQKMTTARLKNVLKEEHLLPEKPKKPRPRMNLKTEVKNLLKKLPPKLEVEDRQPIHDLIKQLRTKVNRIEKGKTNITTGLNINKTIHNVELSHTELSILYYALETTQALNDDIGAGITKDVLELTEKIKKLIK